MKTIAFKVPKNKNANIVLEVIKKFGFKPEISEDVPKNKRYSRLIEVASKTSKRELTPSQIDKIISIERNKA